MSTFLEFEALLGVEFMHPGGYSATRAVLAHLAPEPGARVLELGCGTGATACLLAREHAVHVVALERSPTMLALASARCRRQKVTAVHLVCADASRPWPFPDASFQALYAESVVALLDPVPVLGEGVRVLTSGGRVALVERVWKPAVSQELADRVNACSERAFGVPAATRRPLDRDGWVRLLRQVGFVDVRAVPVAALAPAGEPVRPAVTRLRRTGRYLAHPWMIARALWYRAMVRRHKALWELLESYVFLARKP